MKNSVVSGLTLLELLVVVSIMALLSSIVFVIPDNNDPNQLVTQAAAELDSTFKEARKLAIELNKTIAVVFHIENSGDSRVFKNYSQTYDGPEAKRGRHWYGIVGPDMSSNTQSESEPPIPAAYQNLAVLKFSVEQNLVGGKRYLPSGTRLLALGDSDWGNQSTHTGYSTGNKGVSHPRPWFGYFEAGTLYPWGGYNPDQDAAYRSSSGSISNACTTGMLYEGCDGEIPYDEAIDCNVGPAIVHGQLYDTAIATATKRFYYDGGTLDTGIDPEFTHVGKPRPIFDGMAMDYVILFLNDGSCLPYKNGRKYYYEPDWTDPAKFRSPYGLKNDDSKTGGYYFTVARDIDPDEEIYKVDNPITKQKDYTKFDNATDAFKSISPFRRVFLHKDTGDSCVRDPYHIDSYLEASHLEQKLPYPPKVIPNY